MRRRVRLTGRKQLPHSCVDVRIFPGNDSEQKLVTLSLLNKKWFKNLPGNAKVKLRLFENKFFETLDFGTLAAPKQIANLKNFAFSAPSCQLRIVSSDDGKKGLLLGSTKTWTLRNNAGNENSTKRGILMFEPGNIEPRIWKLQIRDDDYPVVYIDKKITNPGTWVRNDPVFISCVLPAIIREVFEDILNAGDQHGQEWMDDWVSWAISLMPGKFPPFSKECDQKQQWIDDLLDNFCQKHRMLDMLLADLKKENK